MVSNESVVASVSSLRIHHEIRTIRHVCTACSLLAAAPAIIVLVLCAKRASIRYSTLLVIIVVRHDPVSELFWEFFRKLLNNSGPSKYRNLSTIIVILSFVSEPPACHIHLLPSHGVARIDECYVVPDSWYDQNYSACLHWYIACDRHSGHCCACFVRQSHIDSLHYVAHAISRKSRSVHSWFCRNSRSN